MARTDVTPTQLIHATGVDTSAIPVTIDATLVTNGVRVVTAGAKRGTIVIRATNTSGAEKDLTLQSGGFPGAGTTDLVTVVPAGDEIMLAITETALYEQADESYWLDFEANFTGALTVLRVPH